MTRDICCSAVVRVSHAHAAHPGIARGAADPLTHSHQLGGGCELALSTDIILASPTATFGQPEINLGTIPGGGGTQRLAHAVGKARAMELVLSGRTFSAAEAERWGVVSRVVGEGEGEVVREAVALGKVIASKGRIAVQAAKEAVNAGASCARARR